MAKGKRWTPELFWAMGKRVGDCLEWQGRVNGWGYGAIGYEQEQRTASTVAWQLLHGRAPEGMLVCHTCDNRRCFEPTHLFLGTPGDNSRDMAVKGRNITAWGRPGNPSPNLRFTDDEVREMRALHEQGMSYRAIGRKFQAFPMVVYRIVNRQRRSSVA